MKLSDVSQYNTIYLLHGHKRSVSVRNGCQRHCTGRPQQTRVTDHRAPVPSVSQTPPRLVHAITHSTGETRLSHQRGSNQWSSYFREIIAYSTMTNYNAGTQEKIRSVLQTVWMPRNEEKKLAAGVGLTDLNRFNFN